MALPKDIDHVSLEITQGGHTLVDKASDVGSDALLLPATFRVKSTGDPTPVTIRAIGYKNGDLRVERDAITPFPTDSVGEVRLALDYLCVGTARTVRDGGVASTCPDGKTCVNGACKSPVVQPETPGVGADAGASGCFPVATCFDSAKPAMVDSTNCVVTLPDGTDPAKVNVALQFPTGGVGVCGTTACWVALKGWTVNDGELDLPPAACEDASSQGGTIVISTACNSEPEAISICGPWSSVMMPMSEPETMPGGIVHSCDGPDTQACDLCGTQSRTCTNGVRGPWGTCMNQGVCEPGATLSCGSGGSQRCGDGCQWGPCTCPTDQLTCGTDGTCASPTDAHTCGSCSNDCTALPGVVAKSADCSAGQCSYHCQSGFADCENKGTGCATDLSDPSTCGTCSNDCTNLPHVRGSVSCDAGKCAFPALSCATGFGDCNGDPTDGCETALDDADHCGSCSTACSGVDSLCNASSSPAKCASSCASAICGSSCVNTNTDVNHCGGCDTTCHATAHGQAACADGHCGIACNSGFTACSAACVDVMSDASNCGGCGHKCASGTCSAGKCTCVGPTSQSCGNCGTQTRSCNADGSFSAWSACSQPAGACSPSSTEACDVNGAQTCGTMCTWSACSCNLGFSLCGSTCVAEKSDAGNCGACGHQCTKGVGCQNGVCQCSAPAPEPCGTCNTGTQTGTCNADGSVSWSACTGGANLQTDSAHCGSCTNACVSGSTCTSGACSCTPAAPQPCGTCNTGTQTASCNQDGSVSWSTCNGGANLQTESAHCGTCTNACVSSSTCSGGACSCPAATQPCGNCGTQSQTCDSHGNPNGWATCTGQGACSPGTSQSCACDSCNKGTQTCSSTSCQWNACTCSTSLSSCGSACVDTQKDSKNCGACGNTCSGQCLGGHCALTNVTAISAGAHHNCALISGGTVECWGENSNGQLGNGTQSTALNPVKVSTLTGAVAVAAGAYHTCALLPGGTVYCWGANAHGELGNGTITSSPVLVPAQVPGLSGVVALASGGDPTLNRGFTCALLSGGTVECWGANGYGELGNGMTTDSPSPVSTGLSGVTQITAGATHACALLSDGSMRCWGEGTECELGNRLQQNSSTPTVVNNLNSTISTVSAVTAGDQFTCLLTAGVAECVGNNGLGQLCAGNFSEAEDFAPVYASANPFVELTGVVAVSTETATCMLLSGGTVECCGTPYTSNASTITPAPISGLTGVTAISLGYGHGCALISNGTVECWGQGDTLGNGTSATSFSPATVLL